MLPTAFQPTSPHEVGYSLIDSKKGFGVVPMVRYWTSMISSAGRLPTPPGRPKPAANVCFWSSSLTMPSQGFMRVSLLESSLGRPIIISQIDGVDDLHPRRKYVSAT